MLPEPLVPAAGNPPPNALPCCGIAVDVVAGIGTDEDEDSGLYLNVDWEAASDVDAGTDAEPDEDSGLYLNVDWEAASDADAGKDVDADDDRGLYLNVD